MGTELQPYIGPRPFERGDRDLFFGRDSETRTLLSLVVANCAVLLYAQSGAGKTSLLNAKLIPLLEERGFERLPLARVRGLSGEDAESSQVQNLYVFNVLSSWAEDEADPTEIERMAQMSLASFLSERKHPVDEDGTSLPRIVIFDQFEELFSFYPERWAEREDFFRQVAEALEEDPLLRVLFVMREDFLASLSSYTKLLPERLRTRYRLERLRAESARKAVEGPLQGTGRSFADGVSSRLVQELLKIRVRSATGEVIDTPGEYVEPVQLQVVCQSLWLNLPDDVAEITDDALQTFGDVEEALVNFYERTIETAERETGVSKGDLRRWFNDELITSAGTRGTVFRDAEKEHTGSIPNLAVDALESQHIIRAEARAGGRWYELTHDRLIEPIRKANESWAESQRAEEQRQQVEAERRRVRAEEQARTIKRFLYLTVALVVVALVAIVATVFALHQVRRAEQQSRIALSRQLAAQASNHLDNQLDLSLLLSVEAYRIDKTMEARSSLLNGLRHNPHLDTFLHGHRSSVWSVCFSSDGKILGAFSFKLAESRRGLKRGMVSVINVDNVT